MESSAQSYDTIFTELVFLTSATVSSLASQVALGASHQTRSSCAHLESDSSGRTLRHIARASISIKVTLITVATMLESLWTTLREQNLVAKYNHLTLHRVPGPRSWSYFLPPFMTFVALLVPPHILRFAKLRFLVLPAIITVQIYVWNKHDSFDVISMQTILTSFALLGWYDVRRNFRLVVRHPSHVQEQTYPPNLRKRFSWIATLYISLQFKDFLIGQRTHDLKEMNRKPETRFSHALQKAVLSCGLSYSLLSITTYLIQDMHYFPCIEIPGVACPATLTGIAKNGFAIFIHVYAAASLLLAHLPTLLILLAISPFSFLRHHPWISPLAQNKPFGPIASIWQTGGSRQGWGLRSFWGSFWHQNMRYVTSAPGMALAAVLGIPSRTTLWYLVVAGQAFFWSGVIHAGMVPPFPLHTAWTCTALRLRVAGFFWLQFVGVMTESAVDSVIRHRQSGAASSSAKRTHPIWSPIAFIWASMFIIVTLWLTVLPAGRELGWWQLRPIPTSQWQDVWGAVRPYVKFIKI